MCGQYSIRFRIPYFIIYTVQNAGKTAGTLAEKTIKPFTEFRFLYLTGIGFAHRSNFIGEDYPSFQEIEFSEELQTIHIE